MKKTYHPKFPLTIILVMIASWTCSYSLFSSWKVSGSSMQLICGILFLSVFLIFSKPLLEWKRIEIENSYLSVFKRFYKPLRINIAESLYQIDVMDNRILSFHFRQGENHFVQISPSIYINGDEIAFILLKYIKKHKLPVDVVVK